MSDKIPLKEIPRHEPTPIQMHKAAYIPIPIIRVEDWSLQPPFATRYVRKNNDLELRAVYSKLVSLHSYPKCVHRQPDPGNDYCWPCTPCENAFQEVFWDGAAKLLDYFAEFLSTDTVRMQGVWFYMLDVWQESAVWLPCAEILDTIQPPADWIARAKQFKEYYDETIDLFNYLMVRAGPKLPDPGDSIIHPPSGEADSPAGGYETGPWISGLKPWQQFMCEGSPGVMDYDEIDADEDGSQGSQLDGLATRYIPQAAIAIIKKHTERARSLAAKLAREDPDMDEAEVLDTFDKNSLQFPAGLGAGSHTYTSLTGKTVSYRLINGAPPITRYPGFGDPDRLVSNPTFTLLDDCVGVCKGDEPYQPQSGNQAGEEDGEEDDFDEDELKFDMWAVTETEPIVEEKQEKKPVVEGLSLEKSFDDWLHEVED